MVEMFSSKSSVAFRAGMKNAIHDLYSNIYHQLQISFD